MLDQIARHGLIDLEIDAKGDLHIDGHHTVEDVGIALGMAVREALGDKRGLVRYGHAYVPLDEALSRVVIDFSGRPSLTMNVPFKAGMDRDGTKSGFDLALTRAVADAVAVPVIASGGVGSLAHLSEGIRIGGADAVLAASIFHYGEFSVRDAKALLARDGIAVRP